MISILIGEQHPKCRITQSFSYSVTWILLYNTFSMLTHLLLLFLVFPYLPLFVDSVYFKIDQIKLNENRLLYQGDAVPTNGGIIFTDPAYACLVGQAIYKDAIPIWDSQTEKLTDFTTHFSFTIDTQNASLWKWGCFFLGFSWLSYPSKLSWWVSWPFQ